MRNCTFKGSRLGMLLWTYFLLIMFVLKLFSGRSEALHMLEKTYRQFVELDDDSTMKVRNRHFGLSAYFAIRSSFFTLSSLLWAPSEILSNPLPGFGRICHLCFRMLQIASTPTHAHASGCHPFLGSAECEQVVSLQHDNFQSQCLNAIRNMP
jgi:hypothetical protein